MVIIIRHCFENMFPFSVPLLPNKYDLHQVPLQLPRPLLASTFTWDTARRTHSYCSGAASSWARRCVDVDTKLYICIFKYCFLQVPDTEEEERNEVKNTIQQTVSHFTSNANKVTLIYNHIMHCVAACQALRDQNI